MSAAEKCDVCGCALSDDGHCRTESCPRFDATPDTADTAAAEKFPTPWETFGTAPNGESWVAAYAPVTGGSYDEPPEQADTRLFSAPPEVAEFVARVVNAHEDLLAFARLVFEMKGDISIDDLNTGRNASLRHLAERVLATARGGK